ncbi:GDSL esterase/lipase At2g40250-like [Andrographis paniculata]|uniref:GDSL esterase/lipase At2g40250-like n=1 Tax=Andrographis paniculata TaxID=175694 RepID=UPI0021E72D52|nr:GDSL esterase/lipase At2g40250-like [Andrographis paniculata]
MATAKYLLTSIAAALLLLLPPTDAAAFRRRPTAVFAFGDSILDAGNNNFFPTLFRSNHRPYGVDFPGGVATGRFSDGKLATDVVVSALGIKELLPAYLDPVLTDPGLLTGASFASAGSGLDDLTARQANVLTMGRQLAYFQEALGRMRRAAGGLAAGRAVENGLFMVAAGSNDVMFGLLLRRNCSVPEYHDLMLGNLEVFIKKLVNMGAQKFAVLGLPPIGCLPLQMGLAGHRASRTCVARQNIDAQSYNTKLQALILRLQISLPLGSKLAYVDIYTPLINTILSPSAYGFERAMEGCCGSGYLEMGPLCNALSAVCPNPSNYVFWDAVHPTHKTYAILAANFLHNVLPTLYY